MTRRNQLGPESPRYDWEAIELDYKAGILPLEGICQKHGVSRNRLVSIAKSRGWERLPPPTAAEVHGLASSGFPPTAARHESFHIDDLKKTALMTAAQVVTVHRTDVAKLRHNATILIERLGMVITGTEVTLPCLGARESPADLLEKLSRVLTRTVQLERQSYGLDSMAQNPDGTNSAEEATVQAVNDELATLKRQLDEISNTKAKQSPTEKVKT